MTNGIYILDGTRKKSVDFDRDLSVLAVATTKGRSKLSYTSCTMSFNKHRRVWVQERMTSSYVVMYCTPCVVLLVLNIHI